MNKRRIALSLIFIFVFSGGYAQQFRLTDPVIQRSVETHDIKSYLEVYIKTGVIVLDFEGLGQNDPINDFYNGGTSGLGQVGENYGVAFSSNAIGFYQGNFSGNPSGVTIMILDSGVPYMNVPAGFDTGFSFYYCSWDDGFVEVYDELDGEGNLLARIPFLATTTSNSCDDWVPVSVPFSGTAKSVVFGGVQNRTGFDDVTIGSITPGGQPASVPLSGLAFFTAILFMAGFLLYRFHFKP